MWFLRDDRGIKLPRGLETFESKKDLINVTGRPRPGDVAIIQVMTGKFAINGHVALVRSVGDNSLTIEEANKTPNTITERTVEARTFETAESRFSIVGYYRPN